MPDSVKRVSGGMRPTLTALPACHADSDHPELFEGRLPNVVETLGVDPSDAAPDYWRHVHSRLAVGEALRPYTMARHKAWLLRQRLEP